MHYFFTGIAGSAMNALALYLKAKGHAVSGSDRSFDRNENVDTKQRLEKAGITLYPHDGSGVTKDVDTLVYTRVVESDTADRMAAERQNIPQVLHRYLLAEHLAKTDNICIAGVSGKTTTVSLTGYVLEQLKEDPTIFCGSKMRNFHSYLKIGHSDLVVIETDESGKDDDIISLVPPAYALSHNIARDHHSIDEIIPYFQRFSDKASKASFFNLDCPYISKLNRTTCKKAVTYAIHHSADIQAKNVQYFFDHVEFSVKNVPFSIPLPGEHNVSNALGMIAICHEMGYSLDSISKAVKGFQNPKMRFDIIGHKNDIWVVNDFAHNGDKIAAILKAVAPFAKHTYILFQPHGVAPTEMMQNEYVETFSKYVRPQDTLYLSEIYWRDKVTNPSISSKDLAERTAKGNVIFTKNLQQGVDGICRAVKPGDVVLVLGARDPTLPDVAKEILNRL
ncbi:MAG: hypothetical protein JW812_03215 [Alphaproteobacteria bacterium]|nr:hypothetical protein [Alphaproteobacteria bacterium]MBN2779854.1 hypothetical protein [Alphaproteobacteria bacterium]